MKVWSKVVLQDRNKDVELMSKSLTNYLYGYGPIRDISRKYNMSLEDRTLLDQYTANRIAGVLMLYLTKDYTRINDIMNKYNIDASVVEEIYPEIEGYIERK